MSDFGRSTEKRFSIYNTNAPITPGPGHYTTHIPASPPTTNQTINAQTSYIPTSRTYRFAFHSPQRRHSTPAQNNNDPITSTHDFCKVSPARNSAHKQRTLKRLSSPGIMQHASPVSRLSRVEEQELEPGAASITLASLINEQPTNLVAVRRYKFARSANAIDQDVQNDAILSRDVTPHTMLSNDDQPSDHHVQEPAMNHMQTKIAMLEANLAAMSAEKSCLFTQLNDATQTLSTLRTEHSFIKDVADQQVRETRRRITAHELAQTQCDSLSALLDAANARASALRSQLDAAEIARDDMQQQLQDKERDLKVIGNQLSQAQRDMVELQSVNSNVRHSLVSIVAERDTVVAHLHEVQHELDNARKELQRQTNSTLISDNLDPLPRKLYQHLRTKDDLHDLLDHLDGQLAHLSASELKKQQHSTLIDELRAAREHLPRLLTQHEDAIVLLRNRIAAQNTTAIVQVERSVIKRDVSAREHHDAYVSVLQPISDTKRNSISSQLIKHTNTVAAVAIAHQKLVLDGELRDENCHPMSTTHVNKFQLNGTIPL